MKKLIYYSLVALFALFAGSARAQFTITSHNINNYADSFCAPSYFVVQTSGFVSGLEIHTYYGDGTSDVNPVMSAFIGGTCYYNHDYTSAGTYTVKQVLTLSGAPIDSVISSYDVHFCQTFIFRAYEDLNGNCTYDSATESPVTMPISLAVDSNGVRIDTFVVYSGLRYQVEGNPGDVYAFHVIETPPGAVMTCPLSGVLYDTVSTIVNDYHVKDFAFQCSAATGFNAGELVTTRAGRHRFEATILVTNDYCSSSPVTLTMNMSPKYDFVDAYPTPTSVVGHTITWTFPSVSVLSPRVVYVHGEVPGTWLVAGDTAQSSYYITPLTGDTDTSNNSVVIADTVTSSFDPNDKAVNPPSWIPISTTGVTLTYTLRFENTGNDTAFNIHIMDTLSDYLNVRTLSILGSTAPVHLGVQNIGGHNIVKFDFPNINLLDSTHHGQCDGMVMFSIKTNPHLAFGTQVHNRAGIYFDFNDVVMTNTTTNTVVIPTSVTELNDADAGFNVFPNPASSELTISLEKGNYSTVTITNSVGQQVLSQQLNGQNTKLNIHALPAGSYFVTIKGHDGVQVKQFQKL